MTAVLVQMNFPNLPASILSEVIDLRMRMCTRVLPCHARGEDAFPEVLVKDLGGLVSGISHVVGYGGGVLGPGLLGHEGDHDGRGVQEVPHPDIGLQQLWCVLHDAHIKNVDRGGLGSAPLGEVRKSGPPASAE